MIAAKIRDNDSLHVTE